ncbi:MAG: rRNA adenine N-6-methyltransferase family protein [Patescibacteria group bacterium]
MNQVRFLKSFFKDRNIAAVAETSQPTIRKILSRIDFSKDLTVVEYGPGTGVCSFAVLKKLSPNSRFIGIEANADFARHLRAHKDPRLTIVEGDARDIKTILKSLGLSGADIVLSSIPFTFFPPATRRELVASTASVINPGGSFIVYQYSPLMKGYLQEVFPEVHLAFSPINIPSVFIMEARKTA